MATEACLAAVYTLLKELLSSPDFTSSRCPILIKKRRHQCGLLVSVLAKHVSFPSAGSTSSMAGAVDQAMLQLQAVYTLVLLLQPWTQTEGAAAVRTCIDATCTDWSLCVRQGVHLLVVGRVGMSQRHAALRLSALMVEMFGSGWLFGIGHPAQANPGSTFAQRTLILPIVEIAKVFVFQCCASCCFEWEFVLANLFHFGCRWSLQYCCMISPHRITESGKIISVIKFWT